MPPRWKPPPPPPKPPPWPPPKPPPPPPPWPPPPPPPPPPPRANAIVGAARPTDATANNAIIVLRNIIILRQRFRSQPRHASQVVIVADKRYWLRHHHCSTLRESGLIKFKFRERIVRAASRSIHFVTDVILSSWPGIAVRRTASLPLAYARPSASFLLN